VDDSIEKIYDASKSCMPRPFPRRRLSIENRTPTAALEVALCAMRHALCAMYGGPEGHCAAPLRLLSAVLTCHSEEGGSVTRELHLPTVKFWRRV